MGTRSFWWRHAADTVAQDRSTVHLVGRGGLAHLLRCAGPVSRWSADWTHRWRGSHEVQRLAAIDRGVREAVRYRNIQVAASSGSKIVTRIAKNPAKY